jgi:hypothetical protein
MGVLTPISHPWCLLLLQLPNFGATPNLLPRRSRCLAGRVSCRLRCHAGPAATQSVLPRQTCCLANPSALPAACWAGRVASPVLLQRSPRCHAVRSARSTLKTYADCAALLAALPRCHAVVSAAPTMLTRGLVRHVRWSQTTRK